MRVDVTIKNMYECCGTITIGNKEYEWWFDRGELMIDSEEPLPEDARVAINQTVYDEEGDNIDLDVKFGNRT